MGRFFDTHISLASAAKVISHHIPGWHFSNQAKQK